MMCETCGQNDCICPPCPECGQVGNRFCYENGYLEYTHEQMLGQARLDIAKAKDNLADAEYYLQWLIENKGD